MITTRRILFLAVATHLGGAEKSLLDLASGLRDRFAWNVQLILPKGEGPLVQEIEARNLIYSVIPMPDLLMQTSRSADFAGILKMFLALPAMVLYLVQLVKAIRAFHPSIVHTTGIKCHLLAGSLQPAIGAPVLWHLRDILRTGVTTSLLRTLGKNTRIFGVSNSQATSDSLPLPNPRKTVVHNGIDFETLLKSERGGLRSQLRLESSDLVIGIVGVLADWKGQDLFLDMAERVGTIHRNTHFVIVGDHIYDTSDSAGYKKRLHEQAMRISCRNRIHFLGFEKQIGRVLRDLDIVVHASKRPEPFGRVIAEAMAVGVPVVASGEGGVLEIQGATSAIRLFEPRSVSDLVEKVEELVGSAEERQRLIRAGHERFQSSFTLNRHLEKMSDVLSRLTSTGTV